MLEPFRAGAKHYGAVRRVGSLLRESSLVVWVADCEAHPAPTIRSFPQGLPGSGNTRQRQHQGCQGRCGHHQEPKIAPVLLI